MDPNSKLSDGKVGTKIMQLTSGEDMTDENKKKNLQNELSRKELLSEEMGTSAEALAINVDSLMNYNWRVQVVKNSSYEHNQMLDREF